MPFDRVGVIEQRDDLNASQHSLNFILQYRAQERNHRPNEDKTLGRVLWHGERNHANVFLAGSLGHDVYAFLGSPGSYRNRASHRLAAQCLYYIVRNGRAPIIPDFGCAQAFKQFEILRRCRGEYFIASSRSELDCITANACRATPDEDSLP